MAQELGNTGSFGAAIGGSGALTAALEKRGMDAGLLDQVSPTAPSGPSEVAPGIPADAGGGIPQPAAPQAPQASQQPEQAFRSAEMSIALKALNGVVSTESKIAKALLGLGG